MRESGYYPAGAEFDSRAPYNQIECRMREVEVDVTLTVAKTIRVYVREDYGQDDIEQEVSTIIKETTLTDQNNECYEIDDFQIDDYY